MTTEIQQDSQPGHVEARATRALPRALILFVLTAIATIVFCAITLRVVEGRADAFDRYWELALHGFDTESLDYVMILFTTIGAGPCLYAAITMVSLLALRRRLWPLAAVIVSLSILQAVINVLLKHWFVRVRPALFDEITRPKSWSFPSGHSMSSMAIYGGLAAVLIGLYPRWRWVFVTVASILIAGIGTSRVYLGVHWPTDVIAGWAGGVPFLVVTVHIVHRLLNRAPREPAA